LKYIFMSTTATRNIALDPKDLEDVIAVLSNAEKAYQLTRFERWLYRGLVVSADVAVVSFFASQLLFPIFVSLFPLFPQPNGAGYLATGLALTVLFVALLMTLGVSVAAFGVSTQIGIVMLGLNVPLFRRAFRESARLKELGLSSLSKSVSKGYRRSRWVSRTPEAVLIATGSFCLLLVNLYFLQPVLLVFNLAGKIQSLAMALVLAIIVAVLFGTRRMELTAKAEELKRTLQNLQQRAGKTGASVRSELLEQVAKIERAQIAKERKDAVLQSVGLPQEGYAIAFDRDAAEARAALDIADRIELEDLVAQLSTGGAQLEAQAGAVAGANSATLRGTTKSKRVEIEYITDQASRSIRIVVLRPAGDGSDISPMGGSHA
jgi:hypothetical protein